MLSSPLQRLPPPVFLSCCRNSLYFSFSSVIFADSVNGFVVVADHWEGISPLVIGGLLFSQEREVAGGLLWYTPTHRSFRDQQWGSSRDLKLSLWSPSHEIPGGTSSSIGP